MLFGWRQVLAAWVLVIVLILAGIGAVKLAPSLGLDEAGAVVRGTKIPQHDPFDLGPPAFDDSDAPDY
jgi:hypothetical protein